MTWMRGAVIGERYRLDARVGAGGMGEVWSAEHIGVGTRVALKTLLPATVKDAEMATRLRREAFFLGRIRSDHVARVLDFIDDERWGLILVMEFVDGEKLSDVLMQRRKLTVEETVEIGADLASALSDLHRANVIHRDLKPANVILKPIAGGARRAMIVDFGLSRLRLEDDNTEEAITGITGINMALGTVEYMAPEQVLNSRDVTPASDLYALGALLYRAVAGRHAFGDLRDGHLAHAKITREAPPLETGRGDRTARGLESVVAHALARRPADRYDRADLMLAELSSLRDLARLSALDLGDSDTEEGLDEAQLFELRQTTRMPVARLSQLAAAGGAAEPAPASDEAATLRYASRRSTVRLPLDASASVGAEGRRGREAGEIETPEPSTSAISVRGVPAPVEPDSGPASRVTAPRVGIAPALAVTGAAAALLLGFALGRVTAPAAPTSTAATADAVLGEASAVATAPTEAAPPPPASSASLEASSALSAPPAPAPSARVVTIGPGSSSGSTARPTSTAPRPTTTTQPAATVTASVKVPPPRIDDPYQ